MLDTVFEDKLKETLTVCALHHQRMQFAMNTLASFFPLQKATYDTLAPEQISILDQLIFRFSKLQDVIGNKLFKLILSGLGEEVENIPFIDILTRLEKLNLLEDHSRWLALRETRNLVAHEYPLHQEEYIDGLNELYSWGLELSEIWLKLKNFTINRFDLDGK